MTETSDSKAQRHAEFHTPEAIIFALIKEHTGCTPLKRTKIIRGYDSKVYDVATKEGRSFIAKIKHFGQVSYAEEEWALEGTARRLSGAEKQQARKLLRIGFLGHFWGFIFDRRYPGEKTAIYEISLIPEGVEQEKIPSVLP